MNLASTLKRKIDTESQPKSLGSLLGILIKWLYSCSNQPCNMHSMVKADCHPTPRHEVKVESTGSRARLPRSRSWHCYLKAASVFKYLLGYADNSSSFSQQEFKSLCQVLF